MEECECVLISLKDYGVKRHHHAFMGINLHACVLHLVVHDWLAFRLVETFAIMSGGANLLTPPTLANHLVSPLGDFEFFEESPQS